MKGGKNDVMKEKEMSVREEEPEAESRVDLFLDGKSVQQGVLYEMRKPGTRRNLKSPNPAKPPYPNRQVRSEREWEWEGARQ